MSVRFRRATHDRESNYVGPAVEEVWDKVWNSDEHPGGFIGHMLDSKKEISLDELFDNTRRYENDWHEEHEEPYKVLLALSELIRVGAVEAIENE